MKTQNMMKYVAFFSVIGMFGMFAYVVHASKMVSYLSEDPKVCINCHTMNTEYATWQHSSHRERATCVDCHLSHESFVDKILAKSRDGFKHSYAMTFRTYLDDQMSGQLARKCWDCHRNVPHGRLRSLTATPDNLGVREI